MTQVLEEGDLEKRIELVVERIRGVDRGKLRIHGREEFDGPGLVWTWIGGLCVCLPTSYAAFVAHAYDDLVYLVRQVQDLAGLEPIPRPE